MHPDDSQRWAVFGADGAYLGTLDVPARFEVHEIGEDALLGVWRDDADVEHVRLYRILKPAPFNKRPGLYISRSEQMNSMDCTLGDTRG